MSFDFGFNFGPATPPHYSFEASVQDAAFPQDFSHSHSRSSSFASLYSMEASPEPVNTRMLTPAKTPIRQHGPLLLPKIRSQDQEIIQSAPKRVKRMPFKVAGTPESFRPAHHRSYTNPESISMMSPISRTPTPTQMPSSRRCSPSPLSVMSHQRRSSASSVDGQTLGKYGFPTYRQMPSYVTTNATPEPFIPQSFHVPLTREPSPIRNEIIIDDFSDTIIPPMAEDGPTTTLLNYLTSPNPAPSLVRQLNMHMREPNTKHFWWDVRQIRPWTSFSTDALAAVPGFLDLLTVPLPESILPSPSAYNLASQHPETEQALHNIYTSFYLNKLNTALSLSQGQRHIAMKSSLTTRQKSNEPAPSFWSNYTDDTSEIIYGRGIGRVVGLVKSFDRWNTGMRVEGNHKKVEYLRGLAHLHRHMREHGCRYGFIMTEIELVVVRNGTDSVPHFGYLEVQSIQLAAHNTTHPTPPPSNSGLSFDGDDCLSLDGQAPQLKMTALLALWYLHMLARDDPLPGFGQAGCSWKTEIGAPAEGTRRKCKAKDTWIPEPQVAEKREAKRARGWVWPEEAVGRKELGKRGVRYSS